MRNSQGHSTRAFTILELIVIVATITLLAGLFLPALAKSKTKSHTLTDLSNTRQILKAVHLYAFENNDFCPFPTWGSVPTGPTGWLYGAGMPSAVVPNTATQAQLNTALSNQIPYFLRGQLAPFVGKDRSLFDCPTDVAMRRSGAFKTYYAQRAVKLSTYSFTGAISGLGAPNTHPTSFSGGTYKLSQFRPTGFIMWEPDESRPFNYNDAGQNQENASEGVSMRHASKSGVPTSVAPPNGLALVGRFGGDASFIKARTFSTLRVTPPQNDLRCGPGYP